MVKVKTHSGAKKRFRKTKSGLFKHAQAFKRHLLTKKSENRKRSLRKGEYLKACDVVHIASLLPYL